jgi:hypothetical protein
MLLRRDISGARPVTVGRCPLRWLRPNVAGWRVDVLQRVSCVLIEPKRHGRALRIHTSEPRRTDTLLLARYVAEGGFMFSDERNHDISAQSFEQEMRTIFPPQHQPLAKIPNTHALYHTFFKFPEGPPQTSHNLNGWGDDMVHDYAAVQVTAMPVTNEEALGDCKQLL